MAGGGGTAYKQAIKNHGTRGWQNKNKHRIDSLKASPENPYEPSIAAK